MNTMDAPCDLNVNQSNYAQVNRNIDRSNLLKVIRWKPQNLNTIASDSWNKIARNKHGHEHVNQILEITALVNRLLFVQIVQIIREWRAKIPGK